MLWFSPSKILPVRQWDHQRLEGASCCLNLWIMLSPIKGSIPSHLFMTMTFKAWKLAGVWWTRLLRNPERAVRSFPWQMPYSMKPKPISTEEPLPFWPGWGWEKTRIFKVSHLPPPQQCFRAELGLVHSWHRRGCAFLAFLHCPSAQCKPSPQGYSRRGNYFLPKPPFVCQLPCPFHLQQHYAHEKEFGGEKKKHSQWIFCLKILMPAKYWVTFAYGNH